MPKRLLPPVCVYSLLPREALRLPACCMATVATAVEPGTLSIKMRLRHAPAAAPSTKVRTLPQRMFESWSCRRFDRKRLGLYVPREIHPNGPSLTTFWPKLLQASLLRR